MPAGKPDPAKTITHIARDGGHEILINLNEAQRSELSKLVGRELTEIRVGLRDLADIGDLVAN
jgi:hypothetical protein